MEVQPLDSLKYLDAQDFDNIWNFSERLTLQISKYPFAEHVPASLTSSTSGHLDIGIGEDNQYFRILVWFWSIGNGFVFWLNRENKKSLDL
ncbi:hypothetical protein RCL_jg6934.t1 [Rhizophagus clarus]|uniref:Uncharacterized protein n=1 Tax=Rhizophagus clarus TaxID=94130 RepID=A0A8H3LBX8_9GLOM|nr:hypothetical protein RCL_jg6934.t1 [Rhizophagus clarus]